MKTAVAVLAAGIAVSAAPVLANDSTAELSTGGLIFVHNDSVEMRSEELSISAAEIKVRYKFFNSSDKDVTVLVAFPMPEVRIDDSEQILAIPTDDPVNLFGFVTTADGKPVKTEVQQRAIAAGVDRTDLLKSLDVPLAPHLDITTAALDHVPKDKWDQLIKLGLVEPDEYDSGKGPEKHLAPRWGLQTTYYWEQTFKSNAETVIEHRYQPSLGVSVQTSLGDPAEAKESWYAEYQQKYCIDKNFYAALDRARRAAKSPSGAPYSEERIEYILKTGANWSGPIQDFRLTIDKGDADALVSFCGEDVKRLSPIQQEFRATDYTPDGDLSVLILRKLKPQ
jgi:hypothetical protein